MGSTEYLTEIRVTHQTNSQNYDTGYYLSLHCNKRIFIYKNTFSCIF